MTILQCGFLLPPHLDEFSINQAEYGSSFDFLFGPFFASANDSLTPSFEALSRLKIALGPFFDVLLVRISCPLNLLELSLPEEDDKVVTADRKRHDQKAS